MADVDVSVVIGFKDWGHDRVVAAVTSILNSFGDRTGEVIVSDYGSEMGQDELEARLLTLGARYLYTPTDGVWSRSRALNAGFAVARGAVLISTDADMIFSPGSLGVVTERLLQDPTQAIVLQCRDLPEEFTESAFLHSDFSWAAVDRASRLRPRWGMGGMMACTRDSYLRVRGLDERMRIYGGEDIDFAHRLQRSGCRIEWIDEPSVRMYHMWHIPTRGVVTATPEGDLAVKANRDIYLNDQSYIRNTREWVHAPAEQGLPITVSIATHNRADYLSEAINSVLSQTVSDFELIIVDDGSTDHTPEVVASFDDPRIRYFRRDNVGIAAARNFAADQSRGRFTAVHDDDDIMLPWRLESHLQALTAGSHGTYGGWVDFDDQTGDIYPKPGKHLNLGSILFAGQVYLHPTLMVETSLIQRFRYDETLRSGSDYNLGVRLVRSGVKMAHTGEFHTLRRLHGGQITESDPGTQRSSAVLSSYVARTGMSPQGHQRLRDAQKAADAPKVRGSEDPMTLVAPYLPDHLVRRSAIITTHVDHLSDAARTWLSEHADRLITVTTADGRTESQVAHVGDLSIKHLAALRRLRLHAEIQAETTLHRADETVQASAEPLGLGSVVRSLVSRMKEDLVGQLPDPYLAVVTVDDPLDIDLGEFDTDLRRADRVITDTGVATYVTVLAGTSPDETARVFHWIARRATPALPLVCIPSSSQDTHSMIEKLARHDRLSR